MNTGTKLYKLLLWKFYFDKGFGLLNYVKYIIALIGIGAVLRDYSLYWIVFMALGYAAICVILGRYWCIKKLTDMEIEITNQFNPFCHEMREWKDLNTCSA